MIFIIMLVFLLISWLVSSTLKRRFKEYSNIPTSSGMSGAEVAEKMLHDHRIHDVKVTCIEGQLTDHYNPANKTINLSEEVYHGRHVAAAAVAAHEIGHAVQHATAYSFLQFRSAMVPIVSLSSKLMNIIFMASLFFSFALKAFDPNMVLIIIILAQGTITLFSLVTLPVEVDASNRALIWLNKSGITRGVEYEKAKNALTWAAMTYLVAALAAITSLLYYLMLFLGRRD
jgi:uncharacterized protein